MPNGWSHAAWSPTAPTTAGTGAPAGKPSVVSSRTARGPGDQVSVLVVPARETCTVTGAVTCSVTGSCTVTLVGRSKVAGPAGVPPATPEPRNQATRTRAGIASATALNQKPKACTNVIERMPPKVTAAVTTRPTISTPTQAGAPVSTVSTRPEACSWGTR